MGLVTTDSKYYSDMAAAIREKNRSPLKYTPAQMAQEISRLTTVHTIGDISQNITTQVCDNSSGTKAKQFTVRLILTSSSAYASVFVFSAIATNSDVVTGSAFAMIRKTTHGVMGEVLTGEMATGSTGGGSGDQYMYSVKITVPAGETRSVHIIGYPLNNR